MIDFLTRADTWRLGAAVVAFAVLFFLTVGLRIHGDALTISWRYVLRAVTAQQAVLSYVAYVRATNTPPGFPDDRVDVSLALVLLSGLGLLVAVLGVFAQHHRDGGRVTA